MGNARTTRRASVALFLAALFFGGGLDHVIYAATGAPTSHYGLRVTVVGQLAFAALGFTVTAVLIALHRRWSRSSTAALSADDALGE
jgi:hypothetical protein